MPPRRRLGRVNAEAAEKRVWTSEEYLAWERKVPEKHELFNGEVFAMAEAKRRHNQPYPSALP